MSGTGKRLAMLATVAVLAFGLGAATTGCGKPKAKCSKLCKKMSDCFFEVMQKRGDLSKGTIKSIKSSDTLRKRFKSQVRKSCKKSCNKKNKKGKWSRKDVKRINKCVKKSSCSKFAKCVSKYVY